MNNNNHIQKIAQLLTEDPDIFNKPINEFWGKKKEKKDPEIEQMEKNIDQIKEIISDTIMANYENEDEDLPATNFNSIMNNLKQKFDLTPKQEKWLRQQVEKILEKMSGQTLTQREPDQRGSKRHNQEWAMAAAWFEENKHLSILNPTGSRHGQSRQVRQADAPNWTKYQKERAAQRKKEGFKQTEDSTPWRYWD